MIPDNVIEDIKTRNDIADVISLYVNLKKAGSRLNGLCPFHNEKTPSFTVFPESQSYYCFGCRAAGDVVTFIRKTENMEYVEALRYLANRVGITIPEDDGQGARGVKRSRILDMNKEAARFFHKLLLSSSEPKEYLIKRGLGAQTVKRFGLGYSGHRGYELYDHLKKLGYTDEEMISGRLIGKSEKGIYPFFRNRVMFPIIDTAGNVIAFGGRVMDSSDPKYLNTPDTPAFNKGRNLFALNYAKSKCAEEMILCEGYMDVIACHAAGFCNAVATLGTALTNEQARLMAKYTKKVIISYDGDRAGRAAADKASKILSDVGLEVRILQIKDAKDPDEYIKSFGSEAFRKLLAGSDTKFDFIVRNALAKNDIKTDEGKIKAASEICLEVAEIASAVERELYITKASELLGISKESLSSEMKKQLRKKNSQKKESIDRQLERKAMGIGDRVNPERSSNVKAAAAEEALLGIMMLYPERTAQVIGDEKMLSENDFVTDFNKKVFCAIKRLGSEGVKDMGALGAEFTEEEMGRIYEMQIKRQGLESASETVFTDNVNALRSSKAESETDIEKIIAAKRAGGN